MIKSLALVSILASYSLANPYFRFINPSHPTTVVGALIDPKDASNSEGATLVPLVTHSTSDGCLLPSFICEDWSPVAVGASLISGQWSFVVAPVANIIPWVQKVVLDATPQSWAGVKSVFSSSGTVSFSAGPAFEYKQSTDKGYFRVFTGVQVKF